MKKQIILIILLFAILGNQNSIFCQSPVKKAPSTTITTKTIGNVNVNVVPASMLTKSSNDIKLSNGKKVTALASNGTLTGVVIDGVTYKTIGSSTINGFCEGNTCKCQGIEECTKMLGPDGPCKSCLDCALCDEFHNCVCIKNVTKKAPKNKIKDIKATTPITTTKK
ncbi:MAG: hypothetical protein V9E90_03050 [Saprospiraceae bacterium]